MLHQIIINILLSSVLYLILALYFTAIYYTTKFFHLAHAAIIVFGAYFTYLFSQQMQIGLWIAIPLAIISATVMGAMIEIVLYKPLRKRKATPLVFLITSLGLYIILQNIISCIFPRCLLIISSLLSGTAIPNILSESIFCLILLLYLNF